jgi:DNA-binding CsgD family transcriptional regulator
MPESPSSRLSQRELETFSLLIEGQTDLAIAERILVSCATVAATPAQVKAKLGVTSLPDLMRVGLRYLLAVAWERKGAQEKCEDRYQ